MSPLNMHLQVLEMLVASLLLRACLSIQSQSIKTFSKSLHIGLLPSSGLVSLHSADLETIGRPQLRVPPTSDRVLLNGRSGTFSLDCICHPMFNIKAVNNPSLGKLLFTTTTRRGSSPPRVSVYSAVLAEAKPENGTPSNALLHTFPLPDQVV